ncbi:MAG: AMP-binding protein [Gammaproteobacteria bacterium]|nr:AMP-binding protein [Gammaproteobacteria bacterium]
MKSELDIPMLERISDYVFFHADNQPTREALVHKGARYNYAELANEVKQVSRALLASGVNAGDRIALLGPPSPEFFIVMMATVDIGAIWMGMHPRYKLAEFQHVVSTAQPKLIFAFSEIDDRCYDVELAALKTEYQCIQEIVIFNQIPNRDWYLL